MRVQHLQSAQNPQYRKWKECLTSFGIEEHKCFLLSGRKTVPEFLIHHSDLVSDILLPPRGEGTNGDREQWDAPENVRFPELIFSKKGLDHSHRVTELTGRLFKDLDIFGTDYPLIVAHAPAVENWTGSIPEGLEVILSLQDPTNLGAALRSCAALGASKVILTSECAHPFLPKTLRSSSRMNFELKLEKAGPQKHVLSTLSQSRANCVVMDLSGKPLETFQFPKDCYLIIGQEGLGFSDSLMTKQEQSTSLQKVHVQLAPRCDSLNAVQALTVALFRYQQNWRSPLL